jgi:hypothetical protein
LLLQLAVGLAVLVMVLEVLEVQVVAVAQQAQEHPVKVLQAAFNLLLIFMVGVRAAARVR